MKNLHIIGDHQLPKALVIHPMSIDGKFMGNKFLAFLPQFCYVCPDMSQHGDNHSEFISIEQQAQQLRDALVQANLTEFSFIFGASLGARLTMELVKFKELKFMLVYCDGAPLFPNAWFKFLLISTVIRISWYFTKKFSQKFYNNLNKVYGEEYAQVMTDNFVSMDLKSVIAMTKACSSFKFYPLAPEFQNKLYFSYGNKELNKQSIKFIKQHYPAAHIELKANCNHCDYLLKHSDDFAQEFKKLLAEHNLIAEL